MLLGRQVARSFHYCVLISSLLFALAAYAQPSGGPYGPVDQRYEVPKTGHIYYVAPDGKADASGSTLQEPTTIESAIERVVTGDSIILRGGIYRTGGLVLNQGVTIQPYADERPILKGTKVASEWRALPNHIWKTSWKTLFPAKPLGWWGREFAGAKTPLHRFNNDMVFVNGEFLQSVGWLGELDAHSYYIDYERGAVYLGADPTNKQVEITAFDSAIVRTASAVHGKENDHKGPVIRGITFTQYAYRALEVEGKKHFTANDEPTDEPLGLADPATFGKEVTGTVLENVTISFCSRVAGYFRGDGLIIRNSLISDTGTEGLYVIGSSDVLLERNIIRRNNIESIAGYYASSVKIFNQTRRVIFRDNLIFGTPGSAGVWYDVGNRDGVVVNNYIEGAENGFMFEISKGATVAGNVFVRCDTGTKVLNSADVRVYNNTYIDTQASFERDQRSGSGDLFGWHPKTGPDVDQREGHIFVNNLLVASASYNKPLLRFEQPKALCGKLTSPEVKELDGNVYVRPLMPGDTAAPVIQWAPAASDTCKSSFTSLDEFRKAVPSFELNGRQLERTPASILKGPDFGHYELRQALPELPRKANTPADVRKLAGWSETAPLAPGAYPVQN